MKDLQTWNELTAEVARLERENAELRGSRSGCEMCNSGDIGLLQTELPYELDVTIYNDEEDAYIALIYKDNKVPLGGDTIDISYCLFCGRKLGGAE